jgi:hypothetical protein
MKELIDFVKKALLPAALVVLAFAIFKFGDAIVRLVPEIRGARADLAALQQNAPKIAGEAGQAAGSGAVQGAQKEVAKTAVTAALAPVTGPIAAGAQVATHVGGDAGKAAQQVENVTDPTKLAKKLIK